MNVGSPSTYLTICSHTMFHLHTHLQMSLCIPHVYRLTLLYPSSPLLIPIKGPCLHGLNLKLRLILNSFRLPLRLPSLPPFTTFPPSRLVQSRLRPMCRPEGVRESPSLESRSTATSLPGTSPLPLRGPYTTSQTLHRTLVPSRRRVSEHISTPLCTTLCGKSY